MFDVRGSNGKRAVLSAARIRDPEWAEVYGPVITDCRIAAISQLEESESPCSITRLHPVGFVCGTAPSPATVAMRSDPVSISDIPDALVHLHETRPCGKKLVSEQTRVLLQESCNHLDSYLEKAVNSGAPLLPIDSEKWLLLSHCTEKHEVAKLAPAEETTLREGLLWQGDSALVPTSALLGCSSLDRVLDACRCKCGAHLARQCYFCKDCLDHVSCAECAKTNEKHDCSSSVSRDILSHIVHKMETGRRVSFAQVDEALMLPIHTGLAMLWPNLPSTAWTGVSEAVLERARVLLPSIILGNLRVTAFDADEGDICLPSIKDQLRCLCGEGQCRPDRSGRRKKKPGRRKNAESKEAATSCAPEQCDCTEEAEPGDHEQQCVPAEECAAFSDDLTSGIHVHECPVCMDSLLGPGLKPMVLPDCGHWLCDRCCESLRAAKCPRCNTPRKAAPVRLFL